MAPTQENDENDLCCSKYFPANWTGKDLTRIGHVMYMGIAQFERPDDVAGHCSKSTEALFVLAGWSWSWVS